MTYFDWLFVAFSACFLLFWLYSHRVRPYFEKRRLIKQIYTPKIACAHRLFQELYQCVNGAKVAKQEMTRLKTSDDAFVYGEIIFESFVLMLQVVAPQRGEVFYDLGCGAGKAVLTASMLYEFKKSCGIELLPAMYQLCEMQRKQFQQRVKSLPTLEHRTHHIKFINNDFLHADFLDADIVFINATAFFGELWLALVERLIQLKKGTRLIITSKYLSDKHFKLLDDHDRLMSWGMCSVMIYEKIS